ncbi:MAG: hypothetical protein FJX67_06380 [Alphaproteobacteria bacterium]|nr:hypothetical protein [Alphaproteobacteria bacterium]
MPVILVEDDVILRTVPVILDPETPPERQAAIADYFSVDIPDFEAWRAGLRARHPNLFPARVRLIGSQDAFRAALPEADGVAIQGLEVGPAELAIAPRLRIVQKFGTDLRNIDDAACARRGIAVRALRRRVNIAVAEHAFAMMLALAKRLPELDRRIDLESLREAGFEPRMYDRRHSASANWARVPGMKTLHGATLGALGLGEIGREVASRARAFGMTVVYFQRNRMPAAIEAESGARHVDFDTLLRGSDFISVQLPSNASTNGMIDAGAFARMKRDAILVNISRAPIIDRGALLDALTARRIGGVGLDVHYEEPAAADEPLKGFANVLLTPHTAVAGRQNGTADMEELVGNLAAAIG